MKRLRTAKVAWGVVFLAVGMAGCDRSGGAGKPAAPLITLPPVFAASDGREWTRLSTPESVVPPGSTQPLQEVLRAQRFVAEPMGSAWYILVRNDAEGRCDLGGPAPLAKVQAEASPAGEVVLSCEVPAGSRKALGDFTGRNTGRAVAFAIDGVVYTAPNVQSKLSGALQMALPAADIERARTLADRLRRGTSVLSLRAVVQAGENPDEADLRRKFRQLATGAAIKK